jgi:opacity protein-like surface antigen
MLRTAITLASSLLASGCILPASAEPRRRGTGSDAGYSSEFTVPRAFYVSVRARESRLEGDFDGTTLDATFSPEVITVPEAGEDIGTQIAVGWMHKGAAAELSYTTIDYNGVVDYESITMEGFYYFRANSSLQPFFLFGVVIPWVEIDGGATIGAATGDAELESGFGFEGGLGLAWFPSRNFMFDVRGTYLWQEFGSAESDFSSGGDIDDAIEGPSYGISIGLTFFVVPKGWS